MSDRDDDELARQVDEELERIDRILELDARAAAGEHLTPAEWRELMTSRDLGEGIGPAVGPAIGLDRLAERHRDERARRRRRRELVSELAFCAFVGAAVTALVLFVAFYLSG